MQIQSIITDNSLKLLSGLANNNDSIMPMALKDFASNCAIINTYKKEGTKDDVRERATEDFGTGAVWLFGIPVIKKAFDKTIYPLFKLDSGLDIRILNDEEKLKSVKNAVCNNQNAKNNLQKDILLSLDSKNAVLKSFSNKQMYKFLYVAKFVMATALSAIALSSLIKYKQKTTKKRIEKDYYQNNASSVLLDGNIKKNPSYTKFVSCESDKKDVSFTGAGAFLSDFMFNPIKNTAILDGVITTTRLKEARKGERKEVALKEGFQLMFIYAVAKPIQKVFESVGKKLKLPIETDPKVLFSKNLKENLQNSKSDMELLKNSKDVFSDIQKIDINSPLIKLLDLDESISTIKDKNGIISLDFLKSFDSNKVKKSIEHFENLDKNISNLGKIKTYKVFAIFANLLIAVCAMGILQPKINIWLRKKLNNGDNRNPAIVAQEKELQQKQSV